MQQQYKTAKPNKTDQPKILHFYECNDKNFPILGITKHLPVLFVAGGIRWQWMRKRCRKCWWGTF